VSAVHDSDLFSAKGLWPFMAKINIKGRLGKYLAVSYVRYANGPNWIRGQFHGGQRDQTDNA
jgi:hypothetical protein